MRSLVEMLDRVIGRGILVDSDLPVSPVLEGLRRAGEAYAQPGADSGGEESPAVGPRAIPPGDAPAVLPLGDHAPDR